MPNKTRKKRLLNVDDDEVFRELLRMALTSAGYKVASARNGKEALPLIENFKPHVILTDLHMPVMDGLCLLHWLKEEAQLTTPTLVLTGLDDRSCAVDALVAGATDVLVKPVSLQTLLEKLTMMI